MEMLEPTSRLTDGMARRKLVYNGENAKGRFVCDWCCMKKYVFNEKIRKFFYNDAEYIICSEECEKKYKAYLGIKE